MGFNPRSPRGGATIKFVKSSIVLILFQSTRPTRGSDFNFRSFFKPDYGFNPRSPRGGATSGRPCRPDPRVVSIHAPHEGERRLRPWTTPRIRLFQSTLPTRGSDAACCSTRIVPALFQSTLPTRGSDDYRGGLDRPLIVSIHAPHEGERLVSECKRVIEQIVSIHAPHEGERLYYVTSRDKKQEVSIHAPHEGERRDVDLRNAKIADVSIHAPHEGERHGNCRCEKKEERGFNPRSPRGGATVNMPSEGVEWYVSIHAPHEGERLKMYNVPINQKEVSIHAPHEGERRGAVIMAKLTRAVSIHAPHEGERRAKQLYRSSVTAGFNPRSPRGGATRFTSAWAQIRLCFNPRSPRGGATISCAWYV